MTPRLQRMPRQGGLDTKLLSMKVIVAWETSPAELQSMAGIPFPRPFLLRTPESGVESLAGAEPQLHGDRLGESDA